MARRGRDEKLELLARCWWTAGASRGDLRWLGSLVDELHLPTGAPLIGAADVRRWGYFVARGALAMDGEPPKVVPSGSFVVTPGAAVVALEAATLVVLPLREGPAIAARFPLVADALAPTVRPPAAPPARATPCAARWRSREA